tara:strand:+ start:1058 stop:1222 length:165 start_codon:yes stop_codon:yes gene_type:complete
MEKENNDKPLIIDSKTKKELFEVLYMVEDIEYQFGTVLGERVGKLLTELELLNK